jgi:hypothetical protein
MNPDEEPTITVEEAFELIRTSPIYSKQRRFEALGLYTPEQQIAYLQNLIVQADLESKRLITKFIELSPNEATQGNGDKFLAKIQKLNDANDEIKSELRKLLTRSSSPPEHPPIHWKAGKEDLVELATALFEANAAALPDNASKEEFIRRFAALVGEDIPDPNSHVQGTIKKREPASFLNELKAAYLSKQQVTEKRPKVRRSKAFKKL